MVLQACNGSGQSRGGPGFWFAGVTLREILPVCCGSCPSRFMAVSALPVVSNRPLQVSAGSFAHKMNNALAGLEQGAEDVTTYPANEMHLQK